MRPVIYRALAAALLLPGIARAQGVLSVQGFGFPSGQLSTRALGAGGALGEIDPLSPSNPAVLGLLGGSAIYFQAEPEYRTLHVDAGQQRTSIARFPLIAATIPISPSIMLGLSASNLLDRTFQTETRGLQQIGDSAFATTNIFSSQGAIGDLRVALAWAARSWLRVGVSVNAITGDNRIRNSQVFDDSTQFASLIDTATIGYTGKAATAGFELRPFNDWSIAGSYRKGGSLTLLRGDTTISSAHVPDRVAISAAYLGIRGTTLAVRTAKDSWSRMQSLGTNLFVTDAWDTSVGADVLGPRFGDRSIQLRAGARWRTLPFGLATSDVSEKSYSVGLGTLLGRGHAAVDVAGIRATRTAGPNLSETAWTLSLGVTVRP